MISRLVSLKHKFPGLWHRVEDVNGLLFRLRCRHLAEKAETVLAGREVAGCRFSLVGQSDLAALERFLKSQPQSNLTWFSPHAFDAATLHRLHRNPAFLMMKVTAPDGSLIAYFFLRCFFIGRAFAGLIVDRSFQNQGIGTCIWASSAEICKRAGLRMQATISPDNQPSMHSCKKGTDVKPVADLEDGYLAVECRPRASKAALL